MVATLETSAHGGHKLPNDVRMRPAFEKRNQAVSSAQLATGYSGKPPTRSNASILRQDLAARADDGGVEAQEVARSDLGRAMEAGHALGFHDVVVGEEPHPRLAR